MDHCNCETRDFFLKKGSDTGTGTCGVVPRIPGFFLKYEVYFGVVCHRPG